MKTKRNVRIGFLLIWIIPVLGYLTIGMLPAFIFAVGFLGGYLCWLFVRRKPDWNTLRWPYIATMLLFSVHRVDEEISGFFDELTKFTGVEYPDSVTVAGVLIAVCSLIWLLSPLFVIRKRWYGYLGAWTVFFAMGVSELAHFAFPLFSPEPYGYFPGMMTVIPLAPAAWWGMWRLASGVESADR